MTWIYGQKAYLAKKTGVSRQYLQQVFDRQTNMAYGRAVALAEAARLIGIEVSVDDLTNTEKAKSDLFSPNGE